MAGAHRAKVQDAPHSRSKLKMSVIKNQDNAKKVLPKAQPSLKHKRSMNSRVEENDVEEQSNEDVDENEEKDESDGSEDEAVSDASSVSADTGDELSQAMRSAKTKSTCFKTHAERKRRAVSLDAFGETLEQLLGKKDEVAPAQSNEILSLAPRLRRTANATTLRAKAARLALEKRKEREERAHIKDIIGDWGPPGLLSYSETTQAPLSGAALDAWTEQGGTKGYERRLRKTAQRGVVKLFNAIRAAQTTTEDDIEKARTVQKSRKVNPLGSKDVAVKELSKSNFLNLLRQPKS